MPVACRDDGCCPGREANYSASSGSESEESLNDWRFTANQFVLATGP
jgi:hypothetical protein